MSASPLFNFTLLHALRELVAQPSIVLLQHDAASVAGQLLMLRTVLVAEASSVAVLLPAMLAARIIYEVALEEAHTDR